ncbi:hypothetical protein CLU79DRAFT_833489 [Phycomyces nitens]|nr:hypothetical protein CLU79DRAFT_833489 [Phycomyces nitens]
MATPTASLSTSSTSGMNFYKNNASTVNEQDILGLIATLGIEETPQLTAILETVRAGGKVDKNSFNAVISSLLEDRPTLGELSESISDFDIQTNVVAMVTETLLCLN